MFLKRIGYWLYIVVAILGYVGLWYFSINFYNGAMVTLSSFDTALRCILTICLCGLGFALLFYPIKAIELAEYIAKEIKEE